MIIGIGIDLVQISRVRRLAEKFPQRIGRKVFTADELSYCRRRKDAAVSLAGRFAAKEAVMKALGTGWGGGARFVDIEVIRSSHGRPSIRLHGAAAQIARERGITAWHLSISHDSDLAIAAVIAENTMR